MPILFFFIMSRFFFFDSNCVKAAPSPELDLNSLLSDSPKVLKTEQGILVTRLRDKKVLFEKNPDKLLSPASVTKIATSAALLEKFSPVFTFSTGLYYTGQLKKGVISGDLIIVGDGDPMLVSEKLWQMAADLRNMGLKEITGNIIIDQSLFDDEDRDEGRVASASITQNAYDAPITAFGVNFNTIALSVQPGAKKDDRALLGLDPYPIPHVAIRGEVITSGGHQTKNVQVKRTKGVGSQELLVVSGAISNDKGLTKIYRSVFDSIQLSGQMVKAFLGREGIRVKGRIERGMKSKDATLIYEIESYEMRRLVSGLNTFSNNYIADVLTKRLGAEFPSKGEPLSAGSGNYTHGLAVIKNFLMHEAKISGEFVIENGSGLDTDNRMTARQIVDVLAYMEQKMDLFPDFLASLPATGWDGTMKKRFRNQNLGPLRGLFRAKTGTLTDPIVVSALAGYFRHEKHGLVAFCIIENGKNGAKQPPVTEIRERQDNVLAAMLKGL
jgi:D-alanyl-D-alanine carboxypeptidase/D-alanyl-D-alanine-endopeptidase (penicillin-binding protein 4)